MRRRKLLLLLPLAAVAWTFLPWDLDPADYPAAPLPGPPPPPSVSVRVSRLSTGAVRSRETFFFRGGWPTRRDAAIAAFLVEHPTGALLVDTGFASTVHEQTAGNPWWASLALPYEATASVAALLRARGRSPEEIRTVVLTHTHWDHASAVTELPAARVLLTAEERAYASRASRPTVIPEQLEGAWDRIEDVALDGPPYEGFDHSRDLYGDGTVVLVPLPGHTPGSLGVFVNLASGRRLLFTGDLTWSLEGLERPAERPLLARLVVDEEPAAVRAGIVAVHRLMEARPELIVVPAHDARAHARIPELPGAIE